MHVRGRAAAAAVVGGVAWEGPDIQSSLLLLYKSYSKYKKKQKDRQKEQRINMHTNC